MIHHIWKDILEFLLGYDFHMVFQTCFFCHFGSFVYFTISISPIKSHCKCLICTGGRSPITESTPPDKMRRLPHHLTYDASLNPLKSRKAGWKHRNIRLMVPLTWCKLWFEISLYFIASVFLYKSICPGISL